MERPSRSDAHASMEEEAKREKEVRGYFEGTVPKRHTKPSRSDYSRNYNDELASSHNHSTTIPEFSKFQYLESISHEKLDYMGNEAAEEYVETEYYKDLNGIDKQHHTTGTGFINMENSDGNVFRLHPDECVSELHASCKGNPATNEWIPAPDTVVPASEKPKRSDT